MARYTISIVALNQLETTQRCLKSVLKWSSDYHLVLTDNASTDGTCEYFLTLKDQIPGSVTVFSNRRNEGFGPPHNVALGVSLSEYFVALNNDVEVCEGWLEKLAEPFSRDPKMAITGVKGACCTLTAEGIGTLGRVPEYVEGSCLMIRRDLALARGLFSDEFKLAYFEDSDLSLRMRAAGYSIELVELPIHHQRAVTSNALKREGKVDLEGFYLRNQAIFREKWKGYLKTRAFVREEILVVRDAAIGDVLLVTPVLAALRAKHPNAEITFCSPVFQGVMRDNPNVDAFTHYWPKKPQQYTHFFNLNLAYENRPKMHIVDAYAAACDVAEYFRGWYDGLPYRPEIFPNADEHAWAAERLPSPGPYLAVHAGPTHWPGRNWSADRFADVVQHFRSQGWKVVLVGNKAPGLECDVDLRGQTSFHQLAAAMDRVSLFVGIDSAPMHVAIARRRPTVAVFGCIDPAYRLPKGDRYSVGVVAEEVGCVGCHHYLPAPRTFSGCFRKSPLCMERLDSARVIAAAEALLDRCGIPRTIAQVLE